MYEMNIIVFIVLRQEKAMNELSDFDKAKLKKAETSERQVLPDTTGEQTTGHHTPSSALTQLIRSIWSCFLAIASEKREQQFRESITGFDKMNLKSGSGGQADAAERSESISSSSSSHLFVAA